MKTLSIIFIILGILILKLLLSKIPGLPKGATVANGSTTAPVRKFKIKR